MGTESREAVYYRKLLYLLIYTRTIPRTGFNHRLKLPSIKRRTQIIKRLALSKKGVLIHD